MNFSLLFLLLVSALLSGVLSYMSYFYKNGFERILLWPAFFRFLSIFALLLLLINPKFNQRRYKTVKPKLRVALDASKSMDLTDAGSQALQIVNTLKNNTDLNRQFDLSFYSFGRNLRLLDSVNFSDSQTDIERAIKGLDDLSSSETSPILLISDGVQTLGNDYTLSPIRQRVFSVIVGDTIQTQDLSVDRVNANSYVSLANTFEIEVFIGYIGSSDISTELRIENNGLVVAKKKLKLSQQENSVQLRFELDAEQKGKQLFKVSLPQLEGEREILNNQKIIEIEVVDEKTKIAIIYAYPHPDLGMMKRSLESQDLKEVDLLDVAAWQERSKDYSVYVLYQPNSDFDAVFKDLTEEEQNYFLVAGSSADWNLINGAQNSFKKNGTGVQEDVYPVFSEDFTSFYMEDIGFSDFPALSSDLGELQFQTAYEPILNQQINGIEMNQPLLTLYQENENRRVALFGENLWKWRLFSYQQNQSFESFDRFFGSLVQYLYLSDQKQSLELYYDQINYDDQEVRIRARKYDSNLNLDLSSPLEIKVDEDVNSVPMYVSGSYYEVALKNLVAGEHSFKVTDLSTGSARRGKLEVMPFSAEQMRLSADVKSMKQISEKSSGEAYYAHQLENLIRSLVEDPDFKSIEKEEQKQVSLIDQKWLFALIVLSLTVEWIIRKYRGLV